MDNSFKVRKLSIDDMQLIKNISSHSNINFDSLISNNLISYYGVFKENNIVILGWTFREQKFNRGGMFCCKVQFKILEIDVTQETISSISILINEMIKSLSSDSTIYKFLIVIEKEYELYFNGFQEFCSDQIKMQHYFN